MCKTVLCVGYERSGSECEAAAPAQGVGGYQSSVPGHVLVPHHVRPVHPDRGVRPGDFQDQAAAEQGHRVQGTGQSKPKHHLYANTVGLWE